jgi:large subunit ribosomal protein L30e
MIDIEKEIKKAVKTGKVFFGMNSTLNDAVTGKAKIIIISSNCSMNLREDLEYICKLSNTPLLIYKGSSIDLANTCGKPFIVSALSIRNTGDSEILGVVELEKTSLKSKEETIDLRY